jgi:hypothetical protein
VVRALARYRELAGEIKLRKKVADLKGLPGSLEEQMGICRELFQTLREKMVDMVERRFALLARQSRAGMQIQLKVDAI